MNNIKKLILGMGILLFGMTSCSGDEMKYDISVVKPFETLLNGEPFVLGTGITTKPIFVYKENGEYFANYSTLYSFALDNGKYKFVATDIPEQMITSPANLNDLIVPQSVTADQRVDLSAATPYESPFTEKLTMKILTRTGTLRLKSLDTKADKSYTTIKTTVEVKRTGYKISDETFIQGDMTISRSKATTSGGINYTDDFILLQTDEETNNVRVKIEFLNDEKAVVRTKVLDAAFPILPNEVTNINLNLNDPEPGN
ncbi:hypothetical protein [Flavobacterium limi]|uniref:DUF3823 domain-containing protein n=1 Tax=Flavobacterium limi TaxID=2045105 RepID=A0ABQ1TXP3_9FLAO|nr:hypothetical protein [Flavobacterium limi]GGF05737.1 hypothetical protein GCM10011518_13710 [Flavobacterium limi]